MEKKIVAIFLVLGFIMQPLRAVQAEGFENAGKEIGMEQTTVEGGFYTKEVLGNSYDEKNRSASLQIGKTGSNIIAVVDGSTLLIEGEGETIDSYYIDSGNHWAISWGINVIRSIEKIEVKGSISYIGDFLFSGFENAKTIILPDSLEKIGKCPFEYCLALESIVIPDKVEVIPESIFSECVNLKEVVLSKSLQKIERSAFLDCASLETIVIPDSVKEIGDNAFSGCKNLKNISLPQGISEIDTGTFSNCTSLKEMILPQSLKKIGEQAFYNNTSLTTVILPNTLEEINENAFRNCSGLTELTIPESVIYIGNEAFAECRNLTLIGYTDSKSYRYAQINDVPFRQLDFKIVFKNAGKTVETQYVLAGEDAVPPVLKKDGYILSWDGDYTNASENMIINAVWTKEGSGTTEPTVTPQPTKYTVTYIDRGKVIKTERVIFGEAPEYPYVYRYGYDLSWDKKLTSVTANTTITASWSVIVPEKMDIKDGYVDDQRAYIFWDEIEFAGYYQIYCWDAEQKKFAPVTKTTKTMYTDYRLFEAGESRRYKVQAVRSVDGETYGGQLSDEVKVVCESPVVGKEYVVSGIRYKLMTATRARVLGLVEEKVVVTVPDKISIMGKSFKVTSINKKAFYQNTDLEWISIGKSVTYVGSFAFYGCENLMKVNIRGNQLFDAMPNSFRNIHKAAQVKVPYGKVASYRTMLRKYGLPKSVKVMRV